MSARGHGCACDDYLQQSFLRMKMDFNTRRKKLPMELALMCMRRDIIYNRSDCRQFFCIFVTDLDAEFFFQRHECFDHIEGIESEVIGKRGGGNHGGLFQSQFF